MMLWTPRKLLWLVLGLSLVLRVYLVFQGGQYFWPDERRYLDTRQTVVRIFTGQWSKATQLLHFADHLGFSLLGMLPASIEYVVGWDSRIPATFLSLFSVLNLWLVWCLAGKAGADDFEALCAVVLLALSTSFLYYTRHLLPYDAAMACGLATLLVALDRHTRAGRALLCGILSALTFLIYNGYWTLAAVSLVVYILVTPTAWSATCRRAFYASLGGLGVILFFLGLGALAGGDLIDSFRKFSQTVNQGEFAEGWRLPLAYLWHTEHLLFVFFLGAFGFVLYLLLRGNAPRRGMIWVLAVVSLYLSLVMCSVVLHKFVVYGRLARQLVPFLCLLGGYVLAHLKISARGGQVGVAGLMMLLMIQAGINFSTPLTQVFPREFYQKASSLIDRSKTYGLIYVEHFHPTPPPITLAPHQVVLQARHPLQYFPYQYEGYTPQQRHVLRTTDIRMRLVLYPTSQPSR